jgi:hypothetical protein
MEILGTSGIDDFRGVHLVNLESRVLRLEREMAKVQEHRSAESEIERELSLDKLRT